MGKIEFTNCRVKTKKEEQNYKDYSIELKHIANIELDGKKKYCKVVMEDGEIIEINYFGEAPVL